jgi:predicted permease
MTILLSAVLPVGLIIIIGFIAGRNLDLNQATLSQISVYILAPALVADSLYRTTVSWASAVQLLLGYSLISVILYLFVFIFCRLIKTEKKDFQSFLAITLCPNNGNMGLPMVTFALGEAGLERAIIYMIGSSILLFIIAPAVLKGQGFGWGLRLTFKLPLIWAMLAGIWLNWLKVELPFNLGEGMTMLGMAAIPIALLILGMQLATTHFEVKPQEILAVGIKLAIAPMIAYIVGKLLDLQGLDLQVLILQTAMPTAVNSLIMVKEFGGNALMVARAIILSTIMSFVSLPLIIWLIDVI